MIKVSILEQKFIQNGNTTICIVRTESADSIVGKLTNGTLWPSGKFQSRLRKHLKVDIYKPLEFKGIAVCSPNDEYCELMGRDIAENKAHRAMNSFIKALLAAVSFIINDINAEMYDNYTKYKNLTKRAAEVIKESHDAKAVERYKKIEQIRAEKLANKQAKQYVNN